MYILKHTSKIPIKNHNQSNMPTYEENEGRYVLFYTAIKLLKHKPSKYQLKTLIILYFYTYLKSQLMEPLGSGTPALLVGW